MLWSNNWNVHWEKLKHFGVLDWFHNIKKKQFTSQNVFINVHKKMVKKNIIYEYESQFRLSIL